MAFLEQVPAIEGAGKLPDGAVGSRIRVHADTLRAVVSALASITALSEAANAVMSADLLRYATESEIRGQQDVVQAFANALGVLRSQARALKRLVDETLPEENPLTIAVKLPELDDLTALDDIAFGRSSRVHRRFNPATGRGCQVRGVRLAAAGCSQE